MKVPLFLTITFLSKKLYPMKIELWKLPAVQSVQFTLYLEHNEIFQRTSDLLRGDSIGSSFSDFDLLFNLLHKDINGRILRLYGSNHSWSLFGDTFTIFPSQLFRMFINISVKLPMSRDYEPNLAEQKKISAVPELNKSSIY